MFTPDAMFSGFRVFIRPTDPEFTIVRRRWRERLFSIPWRPLQKTERINHPDAVERNKKIIRMADKLFVTAQQYEILKQEIKP